MIGENSSMDTSRSSDAMNNLNVELQTSPQPKQNSLMRRRKVKNDNDSNECQQDNQREGENFPLTESSDKTSSKSKPRKEKRNDDKKLKSKIPSDSVVEISELSQADAKIEHVISSSIDQNLSMPKRKNKPRKNKTMPKTDDPTVSVNESKTISYVLEDQTTAAGSSSGNAPVETLLNSTNSKRNNSGRKTGKKSSLRTDGTSESKDTFVDQPSTDIQGESSRDSTNMKGKTSLRRNNGQFRSSRAVLNSAKNMTMTEGSCVVVSDPLNSSSCSTQHEGFSCLVCAKDNCRYGAIGHCDHLICSLCSLRMRSKKKNNHCVVCMQELSLVLVFDYFKNIISFKDCEPESYFPGRRVDFVNRMTYCDCVDHFVEMQKLLGFYCPFPACSQGFLDFSSLSNHMKAHDLQYCSICVENRPLFLSEQRCFDQKELKKHLSPHVSSHSSGPHPICQFCKQGFFDGVQLRQHMNTVHISCHVCPANKQHQYYRNEDMFTRHLCSSHLICSTCQQSGEINAFRDIPELKLHHNEEHSKCFFDINACFHAGNRALTSLGDFLRIEVLDFGADGGYFEISGHFREQRDNHVDNTPPPTVEALRKSNIYDVNPNLVVAGRITGSGTFVNDHETEAVQEYINYLRSSQSQALPRATGRNGVWEAHFPSLSTSQGTTSSSSSSSSNVSAASGSDNASQIRSVPSFVSTLSSPIPPPASHGTKPIIIAASESSSSADLKKSIESFRLIIGDSVESIFGIFERRPDVSWSTHCDNIISNIITPLYPSCVMNFAKDHKNDPHVNRCESRIRNLVSDLNADSLNFKAGEDEVRHFQQCLSLYYYVQSSAFRDETGRKYVALSKKSNKPGSQLNGGLIPKISLAKALTLRPIILSREKGISLNVPGLFISLQSTLTMTALKSLYQSPHPPSVTPLTLCEVVDILRDAYSRSLLYAPGRQADPWIKSLEIQGPSAVVVKFSSMTIAQELLRELQMNDSLWYKRYQSVYDIVPMFELLPMEWKKEAPTSCTAVDADQSVDNDWECLSAPESPWSDLGVDTTSTLGNRPEDCEPADTISAGSESISLRYSISELRTIQQELGLLDYHIDTNEWDICGVPIESSAMDNRVLPTTDLRKNDLVGGEPAVPMKSSTGVSNNAYSLLAEEEEEEEDDDADKDNDDSDEIEVANETMLFPDVKINNKNDDKVDLDCPFCSYANQIPHHQLAEARCLICENYLLL